MVKVRTRQDSGVYDGDIRGVLEEDPEIYLIRWKKNILEIVEEEAAQMHRLTVAFREEWDSRKGDEEEILIDWKMKVRESMELTRDLVDTVSNQVLKSMEYSNSLDVGDELSYIKEERHSQWRPTCNKLDVKRIRKLLNTSKNGKREFQWDAMAHHVRKMKRNEYFRVWFRNQLNRRRLTPRVRRYTQSDPEDVFWDWCQGCRPYEEVLDINNAFWNIIMESKRTRKLSEEIGDLPISDRPDVIIDRCEILEGFVETPKFASTPMAYWNVFRSWKHLFVEKSPKRIKPKKQRIHAKKLRKLLLQTQVENYFDDWRHNLGDDFFYESEVGDASFFPSPKLRVSQRLSAAFDHYKCNLDRIRGAEDADDEVLQLPYLRSEFEESHNEFIRLRRQVQVERQRSRSFRYVMNEADWLDEWKWNLSGTGEPCWNNGLPSDSLSYFKEWSHNFNVDEAEEAKADSSLIKKNKIKHEKYLCKPEGPLHRPTVPCDFSHLRMEKFQRRKMNRIFAKQPLQRVYCH